MKDEYYANTEARINTVMDTRAAEFWILVKSCKHYYENKIVPQHGETNGFIDYLCEQWGIQFKLTSDTEMIHQGVIVDEAKYALFLLKFS
jgi:hypothetical protein